MLTWHWQMGEVFPELPEAILAAKVNAFEVYNLNFFLTRLLGCVTISTLFTLAPLLLRR